MLIKLPPIQAFQLIEQKVKAFSEEQIKARNTMDEARMKRIADILNKKGKGEQN